jgi:hypothetical protein
MSSTQKPFALFNACRKNAKASANNALRALLLVLATMAVMFSSSSAAVAVEARKLQDTNTLPSEDVLSERELKGEAMAPSSSAPTTTTAAMEEVPMSVEEGEVPMRRKLLQELGNGPVPSDEDNFLGEVLDEIEEALAPAPAPATTTMAEEEGEEEVLPPFRKLLQMGMGDMMPDMTGMPDPLPPSGSATMGEAPAPAPAVVTTAEEEIVDEAVIPPGRKLLQEKGEVVMDESIAIPPAEAPAMAPAPSEDLSTMTIEETPGRKLLQEELEPVVNGEEQQEVPATMEGEEDAAAAEAPSPIIGTFEITTITGTITSEDYDPNGTGPN